MSWHDLFYNAIPFNLNITYSDKGSINAVVDEVANKIKLDPKERNKHYLKMLILNLFTNYNLPDGVWTSFPSTRNIWQKKSRYNGNKISNMIITIKDLMLKNNYIEQSGYYDSPDAWKESYTRRLKATKKLIGIIYKHKIDNDKVELLPDVECIIVKEKIGKNNIQIEYEDADDIIVHRQCLIAYNNLLRRSHIDCVGIPKDTGIFIGNSKYPVHVNQQNKWVKRIFIKDDQSKNLLYGRFHGGFWQQLNSEWRSKILINGQDTVEVDFSGMGINILYDLARIDIDDRDPYDLTGYYESNRYTMEELRPLLKQVLMIMTNSRSSVQALKAIQKDVRDSDNKFPGDVDLKRLMYAFRKRHEPIKDYFFSNIGNVQYFLDSTVTSRIINRFTMQSIPVLTIHDSYIVDVMNVGELIEIMEDFYQSSLKKYAKKIKYKIENEQYKQMYEDIQAGKKSRKWISPNTTNGLITPNDWIVIEGFGWGHKRKFKDKDYKQRMSDWFKTKKYKQREYYIGNKDYDPNFLDEVIGDLMEREREELLEYKYNLSEYYKKYPDRKPKRKKEK